MQKKIVDGIFGIYEHVTNKKSCRLMYYGQKDNSINASKHIFQLKFHLVYILGFYFSALKMINTECVRLYFLITSLDLISHEYGNKASFWCDTGCHGIKIATSLSVH